MVYLLISMVSGPSTRPGSSGLLSHHVRRGRRPEVLSLVTFRLTCDRILKTGVAYGSPRLTGKVSLDGRRVILTAPAQCRLLSIRPSSSRCSE